jgi:hypothetical protein
LQFLAPEGHDNALRSLQSASSEYAAQQSSSHNDQGAPADKRQTRSAADGRNAQSAQLSDPAGLGGEALSSGGFWTKVKNIFKWGSGAKDVHDKKEATAKAIDVIEKQKELNKLQEELMRCIEIPTPSGCTGLQEKEIKADKLKREIIKRVKDISVELLDTPGTSTGGPIAGPRPRVP